MCIAKGDWVRVYLVQKKVQRKFLETEDMQDLKLRFYGLLVQYHLHEKVRTKERGAEWKRGSEREIK